MPLRAFWAANGNIDRIRAEADQRTLRLLISAQSSEAYQETSKALIEELKQPAVIIDNRRTANAAQELRQLLS